MKAEKDCTYELEATVSLFNQYLQLKPYAYQTLFEQMIERHLTDFSANVETTMKYGMAWALISMSVEIEAPITSGMMLYGSTWYSQHRGPYFRRELVFKNREGKVIFKGSSHSVLLDIEKRTVYRKKEAPFRMPEPHEFFMTEASPSLKDERDYTPTEKRRVHPSHIDCLGHVNNCRYVEFAYDSFTSKEQEDLINLKRMDIYFSSELRDGDAFTVEKAYDGNRIFFRGCNNTKDDVSFHIVMDF
ncbi:acyl-ACP thioesterase domain-containing protein [Sinanaerobacter chloroacetimidivorans]|jgi:medium-chain acyl-[acyl-carrier-protein] hydrolase|uniref:Acyl-ACP thioesterase n=1 Tax=Sinanaerobacter chloroacetimidivorans TaxID=2818044 RepID=A0A8J7W1V6_9FIRM|nr:acyl-ACP thioesterase domain-containing protein [Sinanaerobacter chloroacetimidivorans]MBR0598003.1 hypothetical protein [Sinanaerobacter chloroacetimidivorans]